MYLFSNFYLKEQILFRVAEVEIVCSKQKNPVFKFNREKDDKQKKISTYVCTRISVEFMQFTYIYLVHIIQILST